MTLFLSHDVTMCLWRHPRVMMSPWVDDVILESWRHLVFMTSLQTSPCHHGFMTSHWSQDAKMGSWRQLGDMISVCCQSFFCHWRQEFFYMYYFLILGLNFLTGHGVSYLSKENLRLCQNIHYTFLSENLQWNIRNENSTPSQYFLTALESKNTAKLKLLEKINSTPAYCLNKTHYHGWCHRLITLEVRSRKAKPSRRKEFNKENAFNLGFQSPHKINLSQFHLLNIFFIMKFPGEGFREEGGIENNLAGLMLINMINAVQLDVSLHP